MKIDFRRLAQSMALRDGLEMLEPAIEKEIVHYEILQSLSKHGLLDSLGFQGGTCLRLCYGSERYSEDLDFTAGEGFDSLDVEAFSKALQADLLKAYDVAVRVKEPKIVRDFSGVGMRRWTVVVNTATQRPDIPAQRIKLEIASVPSYTSEIRQIGLNYPELPPTYGQTLVRCQTPEEIMADKLVSFSATEGYIRHRDLWDIPWLDALPQIDRTAIPDLVLSKHGDYGCEKPLADMIAIGIERARTEIERPEFQEQMRRFLPPETHRRTAASEDYRDIMLHRIEAAYSNVASSLGMDNAVEEFRRRRAADVAARSNGSEARTRGKTI